jgi:hypothetical protein
LLAQIKAEAERRASIAKPAVPAAPLTVAPAALRGAIEDLMATWGDAYPGGRAHLAEIDRIAAATKLSSADRQKELYALQRKALLSNPLLGFGRLLLVRRKAPDLGLPQNWQGNCSLRRSGFDNEIAVLSSVTGDGAVAPLYRPTNHVFVGDVDLHFDGKRMLFSSIGTHGRWQIFEVGADGAGLRQVTNLGHEDVDNYDACYLPDDRILFASTAPLQGIPCVGGRDQVANLFLMNADGTGARQVCFDQDHNWCPTVMNDGRVMFTRWEYSDTAHYFTRILMRMNPDGTGQMALYGSNSYWPNSIFYARPVPGHPSLLVGIVSGHHGVPRMGELVLFDPARGQHEASGAIQRVPGYGKKVAAPIVDALVNGSWPRFLHPYPLGDAGTGKGAGKYFLVSCQPGPDNPWGIYVADVFDNIVKLAEEPGWSLLEPVPLRATKRPPALPDRVRLDARDATAYVADVYAGPGLAGVPRGTVKRLRVFAFDYGYRNLANHTYIGIDGPWDVHRILGTVPVESDGSAFFRVPANTPLALQPLDGQGKAVQLMRSWFTAMPGENVSCVGCHESQSDVAPVRPTVAVGKAPAAIAPWHGPARGFSFKREVQAVLLRTGRLRNRSRTSALQAGAGGRGRTRRGSIEAGYVRGMAVRRGRGRRAAEGRDTRRKPAGGRGESVREGGSPGGDRPQQRRQTDMHRTGACAGRRIRHGRSGGIHGRGSARGPDRKAILDGQVRGVERRVCVVRSGARQPLLQSDGEGPDQSRRTDESAATARRTRLMGTRHGLLPVAVGADREAIHVADRGAMGMGVSRRDRDTFLVRRG